MTAQKVLQINPATGGEQQLQLAQVATSGSFNDLSSIPLATTGGMIYSAYGLANIQNTTTPTDALSFTIPGGTLVALGAIRVRMLAQYINNSGASQTLTLALKYGGVTFWGGTTGSLATSASSHSVDLNVVIGNSSGLGSQAIGGSLLIGPSDGTMIAAGTTGAAIPVFGLNSANSAVNQLFELVVTHSAANTLISFNPYYASATVEGAIGPKGSVIQIQPAQTGPYTFVLADANTCTPYNNGGVVSGFTVPAYASVPFPPGTQLYGAQLAANAFTFVAASGVTLYTPNGASSAAVGDMRCVVNLSTDVWTVL